MKAPTTSVLNSAIDTTTELGDAVLEEVLGAASDLASAALDRSLRRESLMRIAALVVLAAVVGLGVRAFLRRRADDDEIAAETIEQIPMVGSRTGA